ncbi:hypothetical protein COLO4_17717 [Corchorus olitorius]|uniref:MACPF domain-containing protein n=1 Tax=Corchorus olitorius TaxID=93759 RepID=A0A1R3JBT7_9ROSI|nr:hypothetical protein COLO4_17717 [Corchorus olitorius]
MALQVSAQKAAEIAIGSIGRGYDLARDLRLTYCSGDATDSPLIKLDEVGCYDLALPGGISISNVPELIKCSSNQGQAMRISSDVVSFEQMSEQFNHDMSLSGKIPSGFFNAMFDFSGCWKNDVVSTKTLAFDGIFITLYTLSLQHSQMVLQDHVKKAVPPSWEPAALASFQNSGHHFSWSFPEVDVGKRPVTGLRLYLEGTRSNRLAIHMQHLSSLPTYFQLVDEPEHTLPQESYDKRYFEKVRWKNFSRVCTALVESYNDHSIVTGAQLLVEKYGLKNVLFLRLHFSTVLGATIVRHSEWDDGSSGIAPQSGVLPQSVSGAFSDILTTTIKPPPEPKPQSSLSPSVYLDGESSSLYPGGPPIPNYTPKLLKFVDTAELKRGSEDRPGYWVVSGARLVVEKGKIASQVKYSLLTAILPDGNS